MAGGDDSQERSEEPTEKKLRESRDKGQIPRSREFNTMAVMIVGAAGLWLQGGAMASDLQNMLKTSFSLDRADLLADHAIVSHLIRVVQESLAAIAPLLALLFRCGLGQPHSFGWMVF